MDQIPSGFPTAVSAPMHATPPSKAAPFPSTWSSERNFSVHDMEKSYHLSSSTSQSFLPALQRNHNSNHLGTMTRLPFSKAPLPDLFSHTGTAH